MTDHGKERVDVATVTVVKRAVLETDGREGLVLPAREPWPESYTLAPLVESADGKTAETKPASKEGTLDDEPPVDDDRDAPPDTVLETEK